MSISGRLAWNTALSWIRSLFAAGVSFFLVPFLLAHLGKEGYGTSEIITTFVYFTLLTDLGLRVALSQSLAKEVAHQRWQRFNEYFNTSLAIYLGAAVVFAALFTLLAEPLVDYFEVPPGERVAAIRLVRGYVTLAALLSLVVPAFGAVLEAHHRFDIQEYTHIVENLTRLIGVPLLIFAGAGLYGWAAAMLAGRLLSLVILAHQSRRICPELRFGTRYLRRSAVVALYAVAIFLVLQLLVSEANTVFDPLIIARFLGPAGVAIYKPALYVVIATTSFVWGLTRQLRPLVIGLHETGQQEHVREVASRGTRVTILAAIPFTVMIACFADPLIRLWLGGGSLGADIDITIQVLVLLSIWSLASHIRTGQSSVLIGMNVIRSITVMQVTMTAIGLLCSAALVYALFSNGWGMRSVLGAAIPTIAVGYLQVLVLTAQIARRTGAGWKYPAEAFIRPAITMAITAAVGLVMNAYVARPTILTLGASICVTGLAWLGATWMVGFDHVDRARSRRMLLRLTSRFKSASANATAEPQSSDA